MKKTLFFIVLFISNVVFSKDEMQILPVISVVSNSIEMQLQEESWVSTATALVTVSSDAVLENDYLPKVRLQILQKMNSLAADTNWNVVAFSITQNESGLEQLHVEAQARIAEDRVGDLRNKAKEASKPGLTIRILSVDFSPSLAEIEKAKAQLRTQIYDDAKKEAAQLNKQFLGQNYSVRSIVFQSDLQQPQPLPFNTMAFVGGARDGLEKKSGLSLVNKEILSVATKIQISAIVKLTASNSTSEHV